MAEYDTSSLLYFLNHFENLESNEFVDMVAEMLSSRGWKNVSITSRSGEKKCDIIGFDQKGRKVYILAKKRNEEIGQSIIQQLHSIMLNDNVEKGIIVTPSEFTAEAIKYATNTNN
ncbi:MAG: restriction endonuclease, partial [Promethearchaeota archaeon]